MHNSTYYHGKVMDNISLCESFPYFAKVELEVAEGKKVLDFMESLLEFTTS